MYGEKVFSDYAKLTYIHPDTEELLTEQHRLDTLQKRLISYPLHKYQVRMRAG